MAFFSRTQTSTERDEEGGGMYLVLVGLEEKTRKGFEEILKGGRRRGRTYFHGLYLVKLN